MSIAWFKNNSGRWYGFRLESIQIISEGEDGVNILMSDGNKIHVNVPIDMVMDAITMASNVPRGD